MQTVRPIAMAALTWILAAGTGAANTYDTCTARAATVPHETVDAALAWVARGGGAPARHCAALALAGVGDYDKAAREFQALAGEFAGQPGLADDLLEQAADAWLLAGDPVAAIAALDQAIERGGATPDMFIDRARAYAAAGDYWSAVEDLDIALDLAPDRDDALALRAAAHRRTGAPEPALADAETALSLNPANADALVERGVLWLEAGNFSAARSDFAHVLLVVPDSDAAVLARGFLDGLEAELSR